MWRHFLQFHAVLQFDVYHFVYDQKQSSELPDEKSFKRPFDRLGVSLKLLYKHALEIKHMFFFCDINKVRSEVIFPFFQILAYIFIERDVCLLK